MYTHWPFLSKEYHPCRHFNRAVSDGDPVLTLGDSILDTEKADKDHPQHVVIIDEERRL